MTKTSHIMEPEYSSRVAKFRHWSQSRACLIQSTFTQQFSQITFSTYVRVSKETSWPKVSRINFWVFLFLGWTLYVSRMSSFFTVAYPRILFGGVQQIQLRTEDRENRDLEAVAP